MSCNNILSIHDSQNINFTLTLLIKEKTIFNNTANLTFLAILFLYIFNYLIIFTILVISMDLRNQFLITIMELTG